MTFLPIGEVARVIETDAYRRLTNAAQADLEWQTVEDRAIFYGELKGYAAEQRAKGKDWKDGWPAAKYKSRYGYWPEDGVKATPALDPTPETRAWIRATMQDFWRTQKRRKP